LTLSQAAEQLNMYRDACAALRKEPGIAVIRQDVHVGASADDARRVAEPVVARGYRGFDPAALVVGSIDGVADRFGALGELGYDEVLIRHLADDHAEVLKSFARLGEVRRRVADT
jgi:hypothetical protein